MPRRSASLDRVIAAGGGTGRTKRSELYFWMRDRVDAIRERFRRDGPNWHGFVEGLGKAGLRDWTGKPPTLRGAQQTWYRVVKDVDEARAAKSPPEPRVMPPLGPGEIAPGVRPVVAEAAPAVCPPAPAPEPAREPPYEPALAAVRPRLAVKFTPSKPKGA